jgi:hypothetical protein
VRYVVGNRTILGAELIDINAMVFGMPRALFPAIGLSVFGGTPTTVGLLYAAPGAGAVLGAVSSGWLQSVERQGRAVILAVLALVLLAVAGASDVVSAVFRNTILQVSTPDRLRGRVSSVHIAVVTGGPRLGDIEAGTVAAIAGPQVSVVSGGLACMAGAGVIARLFPELRGWNRSEHLARPDHQPPGRAANHPG